MIGEVRLGKVTLVQDMWV